MLMMKCLIPATTLAPSEITSHICKLPSAAWGCGLSMSAKIPAWLKVGNNYRNRIIKLFPLRMKENLKGQFLKHLVSLGEDRIYVDRRGALPVADSILLSTAK